MDLNKARTAWGYQVWWRDITMAIEMYLHAGLIVLGLQLMVFCAAVYMLYDRVDLALLWGYAKAFVVGHFSPARIVDVNAGGRTLQAAAGEAVQALSPYVRGELWRIKTAALASCAAWAVWPAILIYFQRQAARLTEPKWLSGARFLTAREMRRNAAKAGGGSIGIGADATLPSSVECEHLFIIGRSGSGKSTLILQQIAALRKRDAKAVIYDFKGDYLSRFYDPARDVIFNPLDTRHVGWSVMRELTTSMDVDAVGQSLVPQSHNDDAFWHNAARAIFSGALHTLNLRGEKRNAAVWEFLHQEGAAVTAALRASGQPGWKYIEDASSKQASSVFATLEQFILPFQYMQASDGDFTISGWLGEPRGGFVFITNYADIQDTLRPILSLFVDLLGRRLLSMPDDKQRRVFFILDEVGSLQRLSSLIRLLTLSRSKGGSVTLGIQDISQLDRIYTREHRSTICNNTGSKVLMSVKDPVVAEFCSQAIGEVEQLEIDVTNTARTGDIGDAISFSKRRFVRPLVLSSTLMHELPPYHFYLLLAGQQGVLKTMTRRMDHLPQVAESFVMRPELRLDTIASEAKEAAVRASALRRSAALERQTTARTIDELDGLVGAEPHRRKVEAERGDEDEIER